ncbi:MAG: sodium:solute symporter family protein [Saprospiraceae bacterium]
MQLQTIDWVIIFAFFLVTMAVGLAFSKSASKNTLHYFLGDRQLPWWILGISMVATTFSADTPNLVTDIVRNGGVAGNWAWWAFLLTGMLTVFVYARLWRRSGITTDLEFYELRYSGAPARFLRGFRAIYLGFVFNVIIMATVMLAGIKISGVLLGLDPITTVAIISLITVLYASIGGFKGVIYTDFIQFGIAMLGMIVGTIYLVQLPEIGGLSSLLSHASVQPKLNFLPDFNDKNAVISLLMVPLAVQWWSVWYPGAEPGGGGYIAQRMLSAKDEKNAVFATLLFNIAHYALRPWPWILIALASLVMYPTVQDIAAAFPHIDPSIIKDDLAFPAMLSHLPSGLLGLLIAALIAALMSTLSTHLNWGSSYIVNDFYKRFYNSHASEKELIVVAQLSIVVLMISSSFLALKLSSALSAFNILLQIGAGTGLIFILRWFWWRVNAVAEIVAMVVSFVIAIIMEFNIGNSWLDYEKLIFGVFVTTIAWMISIFISRPTEEKVLVHFYNVIKPHDLGWKPVISAGIASGTIYSNINGTSKLFNELMLMLLGCVGIYALLFGTGFLIYSKFDFAVSSFVIALICALSMKKIWKKS